MAKRKIRRFLVTVEEVDHDPFEVSHQEPVPIQSRDASDWWLTAKQKRDQAIAEQQKRARRKAAEQQNDAL